MKQFALSGFAALIIFVGSIISLSDTSIAGTTPNECCAANGACCTCRSSCGANATNCWCN